MITSHLYRCYSAQAWHSSDLTIVCEDGTLPAHRLVLAAASPQFLRPLLSEDFQRGDQEQSHLICPEIKTGEMAQVLALIYTGAFVLRARKEDQPANEYEDCVDLVATLGIPIEEFVLEKVPRSMPDEANGAIQDTITGIRVLGSKSSNATPSPTLTKRVGHASDLESAYTDSPLLRRNLEGHQEREQDPPGLLDSLPRQYMEKKNHLPYRQSPAEDTPPVPVSATAIISQRDSGQISRGAGGALLIVQYKRGQSKLSRLALEHDNNNGQGKNTSDKAIFDSPRDSQGLRHELSSMIDELAHPISNSSRMAEKRYAILTPQSSITSLYSNSSSVSDFESGIGSDTASSIGEEENPSNTNVSHGLPSDHANATTSTSSSSPPSSFSHIQVTDPFAGLDQGSVNPCLLTNDDSMLTNSMPEDADLNTAMETNQNGEDEIQYKCELCGERFRLLEFLQHQTLHKDDAPYQCSNENCLKKFKTQSEFRAHRRVAHKSLMSPYKTFSSSLSMPLGLGASPAQAPSTGNLGSRPEDSFKSLDSRRGPIAVCFSSQPKTDTSNSSVSQCSTSGNFICPFCSTSFHDLGLLRTHLHTHTATTTLMGKITSLGSNPEKSVIVGTNMGGASALRSKAHGPIHYQCHLCPRHDFKSPDELKSHLIEHKLPKSLAKGIFTCRMCSTAHVTWEVFAQHFLSTHGSVPRVVLKYKCVPCGLSFNSRSDYLTHNSTKHASAIGAIGRPIEEKANDIACSTDSPACGIEGADRYPNPDKTMDSDYSNSTNSKTLNIKKAAGAADKTDGEIDCQVCYRSHVKGLSCVPRKQCEICRTLFKSAKSYKRHMDQCHRSNGPKHFCKICSRAFKRSDNLAAHYRAVHYGVKPNKCADCGKGYRTKNELAKHKGTCHKTHPITPQVGLMVSPSPQSPEQAKLHRHQSHHHQHHQQEQQQNPPEQHMDGFQRLPLLGQFESDPCVIYRHEGVGQGNNDSNNNNDNNNNEDGDPNNLHNNTPADILLDHPPPHNNDDRNHNGRSDSVSNGECNQLSSTETLLNDEERLASKYLNDVILNRDDAAEDDDDTDDLLNHMKPHFEDMGDFDDIFKATTQSLVGSI
ncbi:hypothetical protein TCAL_12142 [Tigriopus californicus]|uniref:BTB domain-containing protein n=2 Tax=Tigriopus californicus TaxID=6832 RepID=A0A553PD87_TIGCA|nr:hypothetical protein TCAL_12142 [Tigriopus californicus]|eukprot:TCALIF_12142-PA protein Name:"Similar to Znf710 Zinc finger protein 710 (Mus musculus)" AED:0.23 eAED:0.25 QI:0/-1/0/1/-1/1/1/0/1097